MSYKVNTVTLDTPGDIEKLTEKVTPASGDLLIIEDSAASYAKKKVQIGNLPAGGGGGVVVRSYPFSFTSAMGPTYTTGSGAPPAPTGMAGSIYYDTTNYDVYLKTSAGWGAPVASGLNPLAGATSGKPYDYMGSDGDYYIDTQAAVVWGPKALGTWVGTDVPMIAWSMIALAGVTPTALEGSEGDWGWSDDGTYIRIYGPKSGTDGWPTLYSRYSNALIDTGKIGLVNESLFAGFDEIRVLAGPGTIYNNGSNATVASYNGYCLWRRQTVDTALTIPASHVFIGVSVEVSGFTSTGSPLVGGYGDTTQLALRSADTTPLPGVTCTATGTFFSNSLQEFASGASTIYATFMLPTYGSYQSLVGITNFVGTAKFFFLPE